jgi:hypothetical protein
VEAPTHEIYGLLLSSSIDIRWIVNLRLSVHLGEKWRPLDGKVEEWYVKS